MHTAADPVQGSSFGAVNIEWIDSGGASISFVSSRATDAASPLDTWTQTTVTGNAPAAAVSARVVMLHIQGPELLGGSVYFDDATLVETVPSGLVNPGFESDFQGWTSFNNAFIEPGFVRSGSKAAKFFERYGLDQPEQIWHASDPQRRLYRAFELPRATLGKVLGFAELGRGFKAGILKGHMIGLPQGGDTRQLGGAVLFYKRRVFRAFRPVRAAERPDYVGVSSCKIDLEPPPAPAAAAPREARSNR